MKALLTCFGRRDALAGVVVTLVGLAFLLGSLRYPIGTPARMSAGFFPMAVGAACALVGIILTIGGIRRVNGIERVPWRPLIAVVVALGAFALFVERLGLLPATLAAVLFAALGDRDNGLKAGLGLALFVPAAIWLIFTVALGTPTPLLRWSP